MSTDNERTATLGADCGGGGTTLPPSRSGGRCCACNKILEDAEAAIQGYATGQELGLCRRCAATVNTPHAIASAVLAGVRVYSRPIHAPSTDTDYDLFPELED